MASFHKNSTLHRYQELDSTNSQLKKLLLEKELAEFSMVISPCQLAGRGQMGNYWESEPGKNLTFSILLKPKFLPPQHQFYLSKIVSLAIVEALNHLQLNALIKWPNDIYVDDLKIGGVLIENTIMGPHLSESIVGIGLNVNQTHFVSDAKNPVSICQLTGKEYSIDALLDAIMKAMIKWYTELQLEHTDWIDFCYFEKMYRQTGFHAYRSAHGVFRARIVSVASNGLLTLENKQGEHQVFAFKEVEFLLDQDSTA
jgi:BirA family biotin operon repressor/biotin-[acetyl-CoA-carboxylase] ligase